MKAAPSTRSLGLKDAPENSAVLAAVRRGRSVFDDPSEPRPTTTG